MKKITPVDQWQKAVIDHIKLLSEEDKREFAHKIIFDIALETSPNGYEVIGLMEVVKLNLMSELNYRLENDCDGDCDNCDKNKT